MQNKKGDVITQMHHLTGMNDEESNHRRAVDDISPATNESTSNTSHVRYMNNLVLMEKFLIMTTSKTNLVASSGFRLRSSRTVISGSETEVTGIPAETVI